MPPSGPRQSVNAISAVNPRGDLWYEVYTERLNRGSFQRLLKNFLRGRRDPVLLVLDKRPGHVARDVAAFVLSPRCAAARVSMDRGGDSRACLHLRPGADRGAGDEKEARRDGDVRPRGAREARPHPRRPSADRAKDRSIPDERR
ncbi:MAG: hypothetical protein IPN83_02030 [Holophagales bacterium]|nr:hypothetical protein [Holophagales bacterium]